MASLSRFEQLPSELKQMALCRLQDVSSLYSAVLSCHSFYSAFLSVEKPITTCVITEQLGPSVLLEAIARYESFSIDSLNYQTVRVFNERYYGSNQQPVESQQFSLRSALTIGRYHRIISYYTDLFTREAGADFPKQEFSPCSQQMPATRTESSRIYKAFYRYEVFCNIFRTEPRNWRGPRRERRRYDPQRAMRLEDHFLSKFSPWENEQLACVYALLVKKASPLFNEAAAHDIEWAADGVHWGDDGTTAASEHFQHFAATGLEQMRRLIEAETHAQLLEILSPKIYGPVYHLRTRKYFLKNAFRRINGWRRDDDTPGRDDTPFTSFHSRLTNVVTEGERKFVNPPFFEDPDPGPASVWRWAHIKSYSYRMVDEFPQRQLRELGYVMWDIARLNESGITQRSFRKSRHRSYYPGDQHRLEMESSIVARKDIYDKGGRGWWRKDDQSRIVWTGMVKEAPSRIPERTLPCV